MSKPTSPIDHVRDLESLCACSQNVHIFCNLHANVHQSFYPIKKRTPCFLLCDEIEYQIDILLGSD